VALIVDGSAESEGLGLPVADVDPPLAVRLRAAVAEARELSAAAAPEAAAIAARLRDVRRQLAVQQVKRGSKWAANEERRSARQSNVLFCMQNRDQMPYCACQTGQTLS
jgi:hypothetical protein